MKNILFVPIDNRPVTYTLTAQIAAINKEVNLKMPERKLLGGLTEPALHSEILRWLDNEITPDLIILSLDTLAYGGLVPSRRTNDSAEEIKNRLFELKKILADKKLKNPKLKIYAVSSVMRISNNNISEEEKEYWALWGEAIFKYSYETGKTGASKTFVPPEILEDYLCTRKRNFEINKMYIDWVLDGVFDFIVFSKDDTGEFGLNVSEAVFLEEKLRGLNGAVKTGADEIPLALLLRGIAGDIPIKIRIDASFKNSLSKISKYEDVSVSKCAEGQIALSLPGAVLTETTPDIVLYLNNFEKEQGDLVLGDIVNSNSRTLKNADISYILADINNANGADNSFVSELFSSGSKNFLGYAGWNTTANTIGSALCAGVTAYLAKKEGTFDEMAFQKLQWVRFMDDWAYQANIRKKIQTAKDKARALEDARTEFLPFEDKINKFLGTDFSGEYSLPWGRSFEIEIKEK